MRKLQDNYSCLRKLKITSYAAGKLVAGPSMTSKERQQKQFVAERAEVGQEILAYIWGNTSQNIWNPAQPISIGNCLWKQLA
jgi:hypothetical protein